MTAPDPLLSFLCTRNLIMREANDLSDGAGTEAKVDSLLDRAIALEKAIMATSAVSVEGLAAKLMLQMEISIEGFEVSDDFARALIREGRDTFGIGDFIAPALEGAGQ